MYTKFYSNLKPASHCLIITDFEGMQSVVQWMKFAPIVSIPLPDSLVKFLNDSENLSTIVGPSLTCQTTADRLRLLFPPTQVFSLAQFSTDPPISWAIGR